ncbi:MAG: hypothetical protein ACQESP_10145 [Candidatus Muiribacteriota bacterium]
MDNSFFLYELDDEKLIAYSKLSDEEKLMWLEDALIFNQLAFTDEDKKIRKQILNKIKEKK